MERSKAQGAVILTILRHGLPEWSARTQHNADEDILETGYKKQSCVFRILDVRLFRVDVRRYEPVPTRQYKKQQKWPGSPTMVASAQAKTRLPERECRGEYAPAEESKPYGTQGPLSASCGSVPERDQTSPLAKHVSSLTGPSMRYLVLTENGNRQNEQNVDVKKLHKGVAVSGALDLLRQVAYLEVAQVGRRSVEEADGRKLDGRVETHELETAETGYQSSSTLSNDVGNAADIKDSRRERSSDGRFSLGQRDTDIGGLQRTTVIGTIAAETAAITDTLQLLYELVLLVRRHASIDLATNQKLEQR